MGELKGDAIYMNLIKPFASIHERGNIKMSLVFVCIRPSAIYQIECANMEKNPQTQHFRETFKCSIAVLCWEDYSHVRSTGHVTLSIAWS